MANMNRQGQGGSTARNAPFGTDVQPVMKTKIIGGKTVEVKVETPPSSAGSQRSSNLQNGPHGTPPMQYQPAVESNNNSYSSPSGTPTNNYRKMYSQTAPHDSSNSHIHSKGKIKDHRPGAPKVLPPISSDHDHHRGDNDDEEMSSESTSTDSFVNIKDILQKPFPVHMASSPVLSPIANTDGARTLTEQVSRNLENYDPLHFKEMYTDLARFDHGLRGYVSQPQMNMIANQHKLPIPIETLRLIFANFASGTNPDMVNYEKLIQFLARAQLGSAKAESLLQSEVQKFVHPNSANGDTKDDRVERLDAQIRKFEGKQEAERREEERKREEIREKKRQKELQSWKPKFEVKKPLRSFSDLDDAMMIRMLEEQFTDGKKKQAIDVAGMRDMCTKRDKHQDGTIMRKDLDDLFLFYRIPIQGSLLNKVLQRIDTGDGQLSWVTFLEILERVESGDAMTPRAKNKKEGSKSRHEEHRRASEGLLESTRRAPPNQNSVGSSDGSGSGGKGNNRIRSREETKQSATDGLRPLVEPRRPSTWPKRPIKDPLPTPKATKEVSSPPWHRKPLERIDTKKRSYELDQDAVTDVEMEITRNDTPIDKHVTPSPPPITTSPEREDNEIDQLRKLAHDHQRDRRPHVATTGEKAEALARARQRKEKRQREDWFAGFLHLAKGLYSTDLSKTGCLEKEEILRLINNYNLIYQLGITPAHIKRVVDACCHERDVVPIQPVLEILRQNKK